MQVPETEIIVTKDGVEVARRTVTPGEYVFGRGSDADVLMNTPLASRHHARLTVNYDEWLIEDLGSANGTFLNDEPVTPNESKRVFPTQTLRLGDATVTLRRLRTTVAPGASLAPAVATVRALLPDELRERRYAVGKVVAQGGMGAILTAQDQAIRRGVAMKVMLQSGDAGDVARFVEEAQITGQLEHPNIVPVHELGVDEQEQVFYTMKFVNGITLKKVLELLASGAEGTIKKYPLGNLLTVFQKVCDAIAFAHAKGVIHRDLKPENVMIGDFGEVLVMDWGLAKVLGGKAEGRRRKDEEIGGFAGGKLDTAAGPSSSSFILHPSALTLAGSIMGTPQYMAPEQARGEVETMDQRADIYALGAILYHLLALRPSIENGDPMTIVGKVALGKIDPLSAPKLAARFPSLSIPESLAAVVRKAMALEPAARYQSVPDLQGDIEAYQNGFATSAEKAGLGKQIVLAIKRNKIASAAAAIILVLTAGFMAKVIASEKRATQSLARLRETAPTFASNARALIEKAAAEPKAMDEALKNIDYALDLAPKDRGYALTKAGILLAQQLPDEARKVFAAVLALEPGNEEAKAGVSLSDRLAGERMPDGTFSGATLKQLATALSARGRTGEANFVTRNLVGASKEQIAIYTAVLRKAGIDRTVGVDGDELRLELSNVSTLYDLAPLRGMQLNKLTIASTAISDLSPLAGMPLHLLYANNTRVTDLTPLRGMPLRELVVPVNVTSLEPLRGMPLERLLLDSGVYGGAKIEAYDVIRDMPLREFRAAGTDFSDLTLLAGHSLALLDLGNCPIADYAAFRDIQVEWLNLNSLQRTTSHDVAYLSGQKKLRYLSIDRRNLNDLTGLRGLPLEDLIVAGSGVSDITPLAGSRLKRLGLKGTPFTDLSQLAALPALQEVDLSETRVTDLTPLGGTPVERLFLGGSPHIRSVAPLAKMPALRLLQLPVQVRDVEALRASKSLQWVGYRTDAPHPSEIGKRSGDSIEFWKMIDLEKQLRAAEPGGRLRPGKFPYMPLRFPGARQSGKSWYLFLRGKFTWQEAKQLAEDLGGHLTTITSEEEYHFTRKMCGIGQTQVCWLGGQQDKPPGTWRWINGEPWEYTHWAKWRDGRSEPNGTDSTGKLETILAFGYYSANFVAPPDLCDVTPETPDAAALLIEWED